MTAECRLTLPYIPRYDSQLVEIVPPCDDEIIRAIATLAEAEEPSMQLHELQGAAALINRSADPAELILKVIDAMMRANCFACTALWQALVRLEPLIENKDAMALAAAQLYLTRDFMAPFEQAQGMLWFSAYIGNIDLAKKALDHGAEVNTLIYPRMTALLLACKRGHDELACLLLDAGANVKFIGGTHDHETALSEALFRPDKMALSLPILQRLDNGFTREFHARKDLAHAYSRMPASGISYLEGVPFYLDGYRIRFILDRYLKQTAAFYRLLKNDLLAAEGALYDEITAPLCLGARTYLGENREAREKLCSAIDEMLSTLHDYLDSEVAGLHASPEQMTQKAIQRLEEGKPALCFGITPADATWKTGAPDSHAWGLVITKDPTCSSEQYIVQRCDRGFGAVDSPGILVGKMPRKQTHALIARYYKAANWKERRLCEDKQIYADINEEIKKSGSKLIGQKAQLIGNCCYTSTQSVIRALMNALFTSAIDDLPEANEALSKSILSASRAHDRPRRLASYLQQHHGSSSSSAPAQSPQDTALLQKIIEKTKQNPKFAPDFAVFPQTLIEAPRIQSDQAPRIQTAFGMGTIDTTQMKDSVEKISSFLSQKSISYHLELITFLDLSRLQLSTLSFKLGKLRNLEKLDVSENQLRKLHIPDMPQLKSVNAYDNALTEFSIGKAPYLTNLFLIRNKLTKFKIRTYPNLKELRVNNNQITKVKLSDQPNLVYLSFLNNKLKQIRLGQLPKLVNLNLARNQIEMLPPLELPELSFLFLEHNQLKQVPDHSAMPLLSRLNISCNQLKAIPAPRCSSNLVLDTTGNSVLFMFSENVIHFNSEQLKDLPDVISFFKAQQVYRVDASMRGSIAALYNHLVTIAPEFCPAFFDSEVDPESKALFELIPQEDKKRVAECIRELSGTDDFDERRCFESMRLFYGAVHNAILLKFENLSRAERALIQQYCISIEKENYPERNYAVWGAYPETHFYKNSKNNLLRLALALRKFESSSSSSSRDDLS